MRLRIFSLKRAAGRLTERFYPVMKVNGLLLDRQADSIEYCHDGRFAAA
jgi:hypothetical protein